MKKFFTAIPLLLLLFLCLLGIRLIGDKSAGIISVYRFTAGLSLLLFFCYCALIHRKSAWLLLLFASVAVVNCGYFYLAAADTLQQALVANRVAYLGSVALPLSMLMIIFIVTDTPHPRWLPYALLALAAVVFAIAASPGILDIYYKEVSFSIVNGVGTLQKVYGPLHPLYLVYLLGYLGSMINAIIRSHIRRQLASTAYATVLLIAVMVNIGVWFTEQLVDIQFEFLSISYIISELFLLGVHLLVAENHRLHQLVVDAHTVQNFIPADIAAAEQLLTAPPPQTLAERERLELFIAGQERLTPTEKAIFDLYVARADSKEVMLALNITQNTLKFHNKNIYSKLGITSRRELQEVYNQLNTLKQTIANEAETNQ